MATKVKPSRLQVTGTPQAGNVPVYVNDDCFCWGAGGGGGGGCSQWGCITGTLCNQTDLQGALDCKQDKACMVCNLTSPDNSHYPTAKAVADAMACAGVGDMLKSVYDPNNIESNVYDYCNFVNTPTIPTDNCQLANGCGYTTCTGTLTSSNISNVIYGPSWNGIVTDAPSKDVIYDKLKTYDAIIPSAATCSNQLADKDYVNDSINSVTAYYITKNAQGDQFACYAELANASTFYSGGVQRTPTRNDYTIVLDDECYSDATTRYIYNSGWEYQYSINESPMTQAQLDALNSGITAAKVSGYDAIPVITDNCQLANGCGYTTCTGTLSSCADVVSALGFTPYNCTNPAGYTTCTGTITEICMNGCSCGTSGVVDLGTISGGGASIDMLLIGGGGAGEKCFSSSYFYGGGGGGGEVIERYGVKANVGTYNVVIGAGATARRGNGGDTCFGVCVAHGGCGACCVSTTCHKGGTSGTGYSGGTTSGCRGAGGGGANGFPSWQGSTCGGGIGGNGIYTRFDGTLKCYGGGGGGAGKCSIGYSDFGGGSGSLYNGTPGNGTTCGGGGGGGGNDGYGCGADGLVQVRYLTNGDCGITCATGGTVTTSGCYTIHTFTSSGTFEIVS